MLDLAKLDEVKTVLVHDNCADGLASALLLKDAFYGKPVEFKFLQHGTEAYKTLVPEPGMLFCDICPSTAEGFVENGALLLDHHRSAKPIVEAFGSNAVFGDENANPGVCGAVLAYEHVWKARRGSWQLPQLQVFAERFAKLAGIRDTWQRQSQDWTNACLQGEILNFLPQEQWMAKSLSEIAGEWTQQYEWVGRTLLAQNARRIQRVLQSAYHFTTKQGTRVATFDGLRSTSDAAEALGEEVDLIVGFTYICEDESGPKMLFSLRSHTDFDCCAFAQRHGGGGHTKAAGFSLTLEAADFNPYTHLYQLLHI